MFFHACERDGAQNGTILRWMWCLTMQLKWFTHNLAFVAQQDTYYDSPTRGTETYLLKQKRVIPVPNKYHPWVLQCRQHGPSNHILLAIKSLSQIIQPMSFASHIIAHTNFLMASLHYGGEGHMLIKIFCSRHSHLRWLILCLRRWKMMKKLFSGSGVPYLASWALTRNFISKKYCHVIISFIPKFHQRCVLGYFFAPIGIS